jgi:hypothetical protein
MMIRDDLRHSLDERCLWRSWDEMDRLHSLIEFNRDELVLLCFALLYFPAPIMALY